MLRVAASRVVSCSPQLPSQGEEGKKLIELLTEAETSLGVRDASRVAVGALAALGAVLHRRLMRLRLMPRKIHAAIVGV